MAAVIKLRTFPANASDTKKFINCRLGTYKSDRDESVQQHLALYQRLVSFDDNESSSTITITQHHHRHHKDILRHLALQLGSVRVPRHTIQNTIKSANALLPSKHSTHGLFRGQLRSLSQRACHHHHHHHNTDWSLIGQVYAQLQDVQKVQALFHHGGGDYGDDDDDANDKSLRTQQAIVRDLIWIYRHLWQTAVCDISLCFVVYFPRILTGTKYSDAFMATTP